MKKYALGIVAFVVAISLSAFTTKDNSKKEFNPFTDYYWFTVNSGKGAQSTFSGSDVTYRSLIPPSPTAPTDICNASGTYKCEVGFLLSQLSGSPGSYTLAGSNQAPGSSMRHRALQ